MAKKDEKQVILITKWFKANAHKHTIEEVLSSGDTPCFITLCHPTGIPICKVSKIGEYDHYFRTRVEAVKQLASITSNEISHAQKKLNGFIEDQDNLRKYCDEYHIDFPEKE